MLPVIRWIVQALVYAVFCLQPADLYLAGGATSLQVAIQANFCLLSVLQVKPIMESDWNRINGSGIDSPIVAGNFVMYLWIVDPLVSIFYHFLKT